jgi:hypothetical protein
MKSPLLGVTALIAQARKTHRECAPRDRVWLHRAALEVNSSSPHRYWFRRALSTIRPSQLPQPLVEPEAPRSALLLTRNMGKNFGISIGSLLEDDVLINFFID